MQHLEIENILRKSLKINTQNEEVYQDAKKIKKTLRTRSYFNKELAGQLFGSVSTRYS